MDIKKFKKKIEMKTLLEDEIREEMEKLGEKATEILIKDNEIFNSGTIKPQIYNAKIVFNLRCNVDYNVLKELDKKLSPNKILLTGNGTLNTLTGQKTSGFIDIKLCFD